MLSFNNKNIQDLSKKELSIQIYNLSDYYKNNNVDINYTTMTLSIAELLEHNASDFDFSLKHFKHYLKNPNFSNYEKTIVIEGYKKHLNETKNTLEKLNPEDVNLPYYSGILQLIEVQTIILKYKQFSNNNNNKLNTKTCLKEIEDKILEIETLKNNQPIKAIQNILDISLKELYFYQNVSSYIT